MIPVIYVAGPYRSQSLAGVDLNIACARRLGALAATKGWSPLIPHSNTSHLDLALPALGDAFWLAATMSLMRRSDAVLLVPGWTKSRGAVAEVEEAHKLNIPVYEEERFLPSAAEFIAERLQKAARG